MCNRQARNLKKRFDLKGDLRRFLFTQVLVGAGPGKDQTLVRIKLDNLPVNVDRAGVIVLM